MHLRPEDQAQGKVEEIIDEESRESIHLLYNTKQHSCICIGNYQEWKGDVGSGQESWQKSREKGETMIQCGRGKEERVVYQCGTRKGWSSITQWRKTG